MCVYVGVEVGVGCRLPANRKLNSCSGGDNPGKEHVKKSFKDF